MKFIALLVIVVIVLIAGQGWGGPQYAGPVRLYDTRINYVPMIVYDVIIPEFNWNDNDHTPVRRVFKCWMLPFERYVVHGGSISNDPVRGMVTINSGRCAGFAPVAPEKIK